MVMSKSVDSHLELAQRLLANVDADTCDQAAAPMKVPASAYRDAARWHQEMEHVFRRSPLVVAMSCDIPSPGDYSAVEIAGRPIVVMRGDDGVARTFLNICRHRGAPVVENGCGHGRRFACPYHAWTYDPNGRLVGVPGRDTFGDLDVSGLIELPTEERVGVVLAVLTPGAELDADAWLDGMADALALMRLDELHRYEVTTELEGPNWKVAADGYVDGYHLGYLHKNSIGARSITNRNTYDFYGPHVRVGFATRGLTEQRHLPPEEWSLPDAMGLVHFLFPNVSMAGSATGAVMVSRLLPGPTPDRSQTAQYQYFRQPLEGPDDMAMAEERRLLYARVVADEDYSTGIRITRALDALGDDHFRFGRNEPGNQHVHRSIDQLVGAGGGPA
jgi:phenylpropionate dioxygenase-like ring-hydroxylating dioxygenase large terminal subunit